MSYTDYSPERLYDSPDSVLAGRLNDLIQSIEELDATVEGMGLGEHENLNINPELRNYENARLEAHFKMTSAPEPDYGDIMPVNPVNKDAEIDPTDADYAAPAVHNGYIQSITAPVDNDKADDTAQPDTAPEVEMTEEQIDAMTRKKQAYQAIKEARGEGYDQASL